MPEEERARPEILSIVPPIGLPGGEVALSCTGLDPLELTDESLFLCGDYAKIEGASSQKLLARIPRSAYSGDIHITQYGMSSDPYRFIVPQCIAYALHSITSPALTPDNEILAPFCGIEGQFTPVSVFLITEHGDKYSLVCGLRNIGALAADIRGRIYAASLSAGVVYVIERDGSARVFAEGFDNPCGLAAARDGTLYLSEKNGSLYFLDSNGRAEACANVEQSDICVHLALDPEGMLYASSTQQMGDNTLYAIEHGDARVVIRELAEFHGIAFDRSGTLFMAVTEHGVGGIDIVHRRTAKRQRIVSGQDIVGLAFNKHNDMYIATMSKIYTVNNRHLMMAWNALI
ncbi:MAG: hypothetical protein LBC99_05225 [Spirochaetota bacterium]|jgi:sugar lactone lactonase YvrE|nr:hypothetical protein [Spirochaetota bacterium]